MATYYTKDRDIVHHINTLLNPKAPVLDLGSGLGVLLELYRSPLVIALDIHRPFLENRLYTSPHIIPLHADAQDIDRLFLPKTFGIVTLIDAIEHFNKEAGLILLRKAEQLAREGVIVFTPRGFFPQSVDHYGLEGDRYQSHYSGWEPEEFEALGYDVLIMEAFHDATNQSFVESFGADHPPIDALLAWKNLKKD
ncbi:class I SAM-dependent methyltransferase [Paenibacillus xanthanilyticus]|uniref:Class I SAM-dependent methyltransferase n=1 Tax=Paenibacillus xanthanilyticus TaxID=1783531 RepID=A0ABV8K6S5_9BACL